MRPLPDGGVAVVEDKTTSRVGPGAFERAGELGGSWPLMAAARPDGLVVADDMGRVIVFNRAAARLTNTAAEEADGKFVSDVLPLRDVEDRDWWVLVDPYHGLASRTRHAERSL